jgi:hypothetical protein
MLRMTPENYWRAKDNVCVKHWVQESPLLKEA